MLRRCLGVVFLICLVVPGSSQTPEIQAKIQSALQMKKDLFFLASDECEGRGPGTKGIDLAAEYIAKQFTDAGLKPGGVNGFYQPFTIKGPPTLEGENTVAFKGPDGKAIGLEQGKDFHVMGLSGKGTVNAPLVFVGYGLQMKSEKYDEYVGIEMAGKIVVILRHTPRWTNKEKPFGGKERDMLASLEKKVALAEINKAAAVIVVNDAVEVATGDVIPPFTYLTSAVSSKIPCIHVKRSAIEPVILSGLGMSLPDIEKAIDNDVKPRSGPIKGWSAKIETNVARTGIAVKNVLGVLEGNGPLAKEILVVGAHYDHLGYGGSGSLAKSKDKAIHHGADDNASGTTAMMEIARRFAAIKDRQGRKLVFMAFSAEERGLLGSQYFCKEPLFPIADISAMVNIDMVGKLRPDPMTKQDKLIVQGTGTSKTFDQLVDKLNTPGFTFAKVPAGLGPSDHSSFYQKKVPVLFFWTGTHPDYHRPSDTADKINYEGMKKIVDYVETVVAQLATDPVRPVYEEVKGGKQGGGGPKGPKLGITPNYDADKEGVLVDALSDGGAAEKGGLKPGDRIVELAGKNVTNLETYMVIMASQKTGQEIEIGVIRGDKKLKLKVTPQ